MDLFYKPISLFDLFPIDTLKHARSAWEAANNQTVVIDDNASNALHAYVKKTVLTAQTCKAPK